LPARKRSRALALPLCFAGCCGSVVCWKGVLLLQGWTALPHPVSTRTVSSVGCQAAFTLCFAGTKWHTLSALGVPWFRTSGSSVMVRSPSLLYEFYGFFRHFKPIVITFLLPENSGNLSVDLTERRLGLVSYVLHFCFVIMVSCLSSYWQMFQVTVVTSKPFSALGNTSICCEFKWQRHNIQQCQKGNLVASSSLAFSANWMTKVPKPGTVATSWPSCLAACLNLSRLPEAKAQGDFDDSELGVDWTAEVVRSENDDCGSRTIPGWIWIFILLWLSPGGWNWSALPVLAPLQVLSSSSRTLWNFSINFCSVFGYVNEYLQN